MFAFRYIDSAFINVQIGVGCGCHVEKVLVTADINGKKFLYVCLVGGWVVAYL